MHAVCRIRYNIRIVCFVRNFAFVEFGGAGDAGERAAAAAMAALNGTQLAGQEIKV